MSEGRKVRAVAITHVAGYSDIAWDGVQPDDNLLVGRNGAGKSGVLRSLVMALNFIHGKRSEDLLGRSYPGAAISLRFADGAAESHSIQKIRTIQTPSWTKPVRNVLYLVEDRRPKSRIGKGRSRSLQHASRRYEYVLSELHALLNGSPEERKLGKQILSMAAEMKHGGHKNEWVWSESRLKKGGPKAPRPMSSGQYDLLGFLIDLTRAREVRLQSNEAHYVLLDNPEAFLHPALQEELLGLIRRELPAAQVFLTSHSLKLLARAEPRSVFWLSRDHADRQARVRIEPVRDLGTGSKSAFYELYGDDTSSAVLHLLLGLESTEYLAFLCACAFPCTAVERLEPEADRQIKAVIEELRQFGGPWVLADVGAGAGDFLVGAERLGLGSPTWEYIAIETDSKKLLRERLAAAIEKGALSPTSRIGNDLDDLPTACDAIVLMNSCHAIGFDLLPDCLGKCLRSLRPAKGSRVVIHEAELLSHGERDFVMWRPEEFEMAFQDISGVRVTRRPPPKQPGVPIHTTLIEHEPNETLPHDLEDRLARAFKGMLRLKLQDLFDALSRLRESPTSEERTLSAALLQRREAFLSEQMINVLRILARAGDTAGFLEPSPKTDPEP